MVIDSGKWPLGMELCQPAGVLAAACTIAWGGRRPSSVRALLADPRREARLLKPIEPPGIGGVVGMMDVEEERAVRLDGWIAWEAEGMGGT